MMIRTKQSRKASAGAFLGLTAVALVGSAQAVVYSLEDFEGGTPNYSINGTNNGTTSDSWFPLTDNVTAMIGTDYNADAGSRNGIATAGSPSDISPGGTVPSGQHGLVSTSANRRLSSNYAMPLASDGATALNIGFSYMFYALENYAALGSAVIDYSALGDFSDSVTLASFGFGQAGSLVETPDYAATQEVWDTLTLSFTEAGAGISFTDTAAIRFNRVPLIGGLFPAGDATTNHIVFFDDIRVEGVVPEPSTAALLGLGGLALLRRRRR